MLSCKKIILEKLLPYTLMVLSLFLHSSCKKEVDTYPLLMGKWIEYKHETFSGRPTIADSMAALDPASDTIKRHFEFYKDGRLREWFSGGEPGEYQYRIEDSVIIANDITRIIIRRVTEDELVLVEVEIGENIGVDPPYEYRLTEYFRRVK